MKIIVACDGSKHSENALKLAGTLPFKNAEFLLVNIVPIIEYDHIHVYGEEDNKIAQMNQKLKQESENLLDKSKEIVSSLGLKCETKMIEGTAAEKLLDLSQNSDLLVLGSRGLNPMKSFFLGSISDALVRHAHCSVLLFRDNEKYKLPEKNSVGCVVGYDDTSSSQEACSYLKNFEKSGVTSIDLVSVMQLSYYYGMSHSLTALEVWPKYKNTLEESMLATQRNLEEEGQFKQISTEIISDATDIADAINQYALYKHRDLIVVGSKNKNLMDRVFLGSVSNRLAHHSEVPLLIVR